MALSSVEISWGGLAGITSVVISVLLSYSFYLRTGRLDLEATLKTKLDLAEKDIKTLQDKYHELSQEHRECEATGRRLEAKVFDLMERLFEQEKRYTIKAD